MHRARELTVLSALAALSCVLTSCADGDDRIALRVFAAASLTDLTTALEEEYERVHPEIDLQFHLAGSNELCAQLLAGADADVFLPASFQELERVERSGRIDPDSGVALFANRLVWVRFSSDEAHELKRFALADPEAVPAGRYAREWLISLGEWERVKEFVVPAPNVRAALALLTTGAAQEGIVYASDLTAAIPSISVIREQGIEEPPQILYPGVVLRNSTRHARDFLSWLSNSSVAASGIRDHGFLPLPEVVPEEDEE